MYKSRPRKSTLENSLMTAASVGNSLAAGLASFSCRNHTGERLYDCHKFEKFFNCIWVSFNVRESMLE